MLGAAPTIGAVTIVELMMIIFNIPSEGF